LKYFVAILLSILIHISLYFYLIYNNKTITNKSYKNTNEKKYSKLKYIKLKPKIIKKDNTPKAKITPKIKPMVKEKKVIKKKIVKTKIKAKHNIKSKIKKKKVIKKEIVKKSVDIPKENNIKISPKTKQYIDLYGDSFDKFDKQTKLFLIKNIKDIGAITKRFLIYPQLSIQAGQDGVNVVQFILYPNGSIKDVVIDKSSGYFMLDDNTVDTIYEAYEDYPHPKKPTLIKIFVKYKLIY
jgi:protein TonB